MRCQKVAIISTITTLLLVISTVSTITTYNVSAKSNAQNSAANNDCPVDVSSLFVGVQQQASANCLNDTNSVHDSDGAAISSATTSAAPSQALDLELEFGDDSGDTIPPSEPQTCRECFTEFLTRVQIAGLLAFLPTFSSLEVLCAELENLTPEEQVQALETIAEVLSENVRVDDPTIEEVIGCLARVLGLPR